MNAKYLFDIEGAGRWTVKVDDGKVTVSEGDEGADCTIISSQGTLGTRAGGCESGGCSVRNAVVAPPARTTGCATSQRRNGRFVVTPSTSVSASASRSLASASSRLDPCATSFAIIGS